MMSTYRISAYHREKKAKQWQKHASKRWRMPAAQQHIISGKITVAVTAT